MAKTSEAHHFLGAHSHQQALIKAAGQHQAVDHRPLPVGKSVAVVGKISASKGAGEYTNGPMAKKQLDLGYCVASVLEKWLTATNKSGWPRPRELQPDFSFWRVGFHWFHVG